MSNYLFAYGSLQPGCWNYDRYFKMKKVQTYQAQFRGKIYWASYGTFPFAQFTGLPGNYQGMIQGTIIRVDDSRTMDAIYRMETGVGYRPVMLSWPEEDMTAMAFDWPYEVEESLHIPSGDWRTEYLQMMPLH